MKTKRLRVVCDKCKTEIPCVLILSKPARGTINAFSKIEYQNLAAGYFLCKDCADEEEGSQFE